MGFKLSKFNVVAPSFRKDTAILYNTVSSAFWELTNVEFEEVASLLNKVKLQQEIVMEGKWMSKLLEDGFIVLSTSGENAVDDSSGWDFSHVEKLHLLQNSLNKHELKTRN